MQAPSRGPRSKVFQEVTGKASTAAVSPAASILAAPPSNAIALTSWCGWLPSAAGDFGVATTFCGLKNHSIYDVLLGRSELSWRATSSTWRARIPSASSASIWLARSYVNTCFADGSRSCAGTVIISSPNRLQCEKLAPRFLRAISELQQADLAQLVTLGHILASWASEIGAMWRFTRDNGITEGFHTKMEVLRCQAYGFRNFSNYRLRVKVLCS